MTTWQEQLNCGWDEDPEDREVIVSSRDRGLVGSRIRVQRITARECRPER